MVAGIRVGTHKNLNYLAPESQLKGLLPGKALFSPMTWLDRTTDLNTCGYPNTKERSSLHPLAQEEFNDGAVCLPPDEPRG
ncbi:MAG: hypothetical protein VX607_10640 [Planctomycetota bacterium]|nr:hypothetical protein [Planctomycetota bacterium]MEC9117316.1 hypothetical protein [Planctomycetota bacterium]